MRALALRTYGTWRASAPLPWQVINAARTLARLRACLKKSADDRRNAAADRRRVANEAFAKPLAGAWAARAQVSQGQRGWACESCLGVLRVRTCSAVSSVGRAPSGQWHQPSACGSVPFIELWDGQRPQVSAVIPTPASAFGSVSASEMYTRIGLS